MQRRGFFTSVLASLAVLKLEIARGQQTSASPVFERPQSGAPHKGKVLAAIQPHSDDIALLCAGMVAKLIQEGYSGYMIRATNDDMDDDVGEPGPLVKMFCATNARWPNRLACWGSSAISH